MGGTLYGLVTFSRHRKTNGLLDDYRTRYGPQITRKLTVWKTLVFRTQADVLTQKIKELKSSAAVQN